jgi:predicted secreted hydrolase
MKQVALAILLACLATIGAADDAYQVLRGDAQGFAQVKPGARLAFPADHGSHPEFRIEWWYITANLNDDQGRQWGLQWTLFRQSLDSGTDSPGWSSNQLWMAHAAISSPQGHSFEQRFARGGIGQAGVENQGSFIAWLDDWQWRSEGKALFPGRLEFSVGDQKIEMQLDSSSAWVLHGDHGYSQKSIQGQASYYYSQPDIQISGQLKNATDDIALSGTAWLDREWSSQPLAQNQQGWDWFSLHLDDGNKLMLYRLREDSGEHWLSGSWISTDGQTRHLAADEIELIEQAQASIDIDEKTSIELPLEWTISLPGLGRHWRVKPLYDQQWMETRFSYWEGVVLVEDARGQSAGRGYMELTGYDGSRN